VTPPTTATDETLFLFSPSASYPAPFACLIDRKGSIVHAWSSPAGQMDPATDPPSYLRGWNHVELDPADGGLLVTVPLYALLKLRPDSTIAWQTPLAVHHDLDIGPDGRIYVLAEEPRMIGSRLGTHVLLDNTIAVLDPGGGILAVHSLYDILATEPTLADLIDTEIGRRRADSDPAAWAPDLPLGADRAGRDLSRYLRDLPGAPADVLHANTVELLGAHPAGLWADGDVLVCLRALDLVAALDLTAGAVRWWWGPGDLSGPHQPSAQQDGSVLVFDNGQHAGRTRIVAVDPATGRITWQLAADPPEALFCPLAGGCESLPGGTLLISDAGAGRTIEVTPDGRPTWSVQIHTTPNGTSSRAELYRMAAVPASVPGLGQGDAAARALAQARLRLRCEITETLPAPLRRFP
jgi:Arylsulfotransferase (ASST)